jgi:hypothetical protein
MLDGGELTASLVASLTPKYSFQYEMVKKNTAPTRQQSERGGRSTLLTKTSQLP